MKYKIFQINPHIGEEEINEMADSVRNNWISEGPKSKKFIKKILRYTGAKYGVLVNNGTIGLYLALMALGIKKDDEVIVPDFSFFASAGSVLWTGAKPIFVDINRDDFNINIFDIEKKITEKTKAIMPVHIYGRSVDMSPVLTIAKKYNLKIIEDACQSLGVFYKGKHTGAIGDVGCFSFFADKTITTAGEGGMVITNNEELYEKMKYLRNQGRLRSGVFLHPKFGVNFHFTDIAAGFGLAQFKKLNYIIQKKLKNYQLYQGILKNVKEIEFLKTNKYSNFVPFRANVIVKNLKNLMAFLESYGIQTRRCFYPLHKQPIFAKFDYSDADYPNTMFAYKNTISLPVHTALKKEDIKYICDIIQNFYRR